MTSGWSADRLVSLAAGIFDNPVVLTYGDPQRSIFKSPGVFHMIKGCNNGKVTLPITRQGC
jgi:hypothetical protein